MTSQVVDLSVIVVNWKVRDLLRDCLQSVYATTRRYSFEITVVDNDSRDGCVEMLRLEFPDVKVIANTENVGHARAMNQAIPLARGRYVVLLNPDVVFETNALDTMAEFLDAHPDAGAVGGKEYRPDGSFYFQCRRRMLRPWLEVLYLFGLKQLMLETGWVGIFPNQWIRDVPEDQVCEIDILATACMIVRKHVFDALGLLDDSFWLMSEDVDISIRMRKAGWRIFYLPEAPFIHHCGQSIRQSERKIHLISIRERYLLLGKFWGGHWAGIYRLATLVSGCLHLTRGGIRWLARHESGARVDLGIGRDMVAWSIAPSAIRI